MVCTVAEARILDTLIYDHLIIQNPRQETARFHKDVHNEFELLYFLNGNATYIIEDKQYKLKRHDLVIIHPSRYHYIRIDDDSNYERCNLPVPFSALSRELIDRIPRDLEVINCEHHTRIAEIFQKMDDYIELGTDVFLDLFPGLLKEILYNAIYAAEKSAAPTAHVSPIVSQALAYINEHLYTLESIEEISSALFVTENYFFRAFKKQMKISPKKYITNKRLLAAQKRIIAGERPTEVYLACGFHTYIAFYKRYLDFFGYPPSEDKP